MALRTIKTETKGTTVAKVKYDYDNQEYRVELFLNGKHHMPADYFTDNRGDALGTALLMVEAPQYQMVAA